MPLAAGCRKLRDGIRRQLGQQLDAISAKDLTTRIGELTRHNQQLADQAGHAAADSQALRARVAELEADLAAARTSLRRMAVPPFVISETTLPWTHVQAAARAHTAGGNRVLDPPRGSGHL